MYKGDGNANRVSAECSINHFQMCSCLWWESFWSIAQKLGDWSSFHGGLHCSEVPIYSGQQNLKALQGHGVPFVNFAHRTFWVIISMKVLKYDLNLITPWTAQKKTNNGYLPTLTKQTFPGGASARHETTPWGRTTCYIQDWYLTVFGTQSSILLWRKLF